MGRFVRFTAPVGKVDFIVKLFVFMLICGLLNHMRDLLLNAPSDRNTFLANFTDATFTALPMCTFALMLIGHLNALQKRLYMQATQDLLTGLYNRRWFMDNTPDEFAADDALFIIDIDHFKKVNDDFGHDAGDQCLRQMADHLAAVFGPNDKLARIGGEEFAAFVPQTQRMPVEEIACRISSGIQFDTSDGAGRKVTASVGVALSQGAQLRSKAFQDADAGAYLAKARGRACHVVTTDDKHQINDLRIAANGQRTG